MKKILYLTFYFEPDLCAGSFRNTPLVKELATQAKEIATIHVFTTLPNRYSSFEAEAPQSEQRDNYIVSRIAIPQHQSGMKDQVFSFKEYYTSVKQAVKGKEYDLVVASSSRLFTAYLGYSVARKLGVPLYLDIRDIFYDTLEDVLPNGLVKKVALPVIKFIEKKTFTYAKHINLISGGFKPYFEEYDQAEYSYYPNGVDDVFIEANKGDSIVVSSPSAVRTIVYAGNLGEGQGLHKIVPQAAKDLEGKFRFVIIGDGGAKQKLVDEIERLSVSNVELRPPVKRNELIKIYREADFLFVHLNNYKAFEKVLPSKLFELATFPKPLISGVSGFAAEFVKLNIPNVILFEPCNVNDFVNKISNYEYRQLKRDDFMDKFKRDTVSKEMAGTILKCIS